MLKRLMQIIKIENIINYTKKGLDALLFIADGDMRNAINMLQSSYIGFDRVDQNSLVRICDQPSPIQIKIIFQACIDGNIDKASQYLSIILSNGHSPVDIIITMFRVIKNFQIKDEKLKLDWIKEITFINMRIMDGLETYNQLSGLLGKLCMLAIKLETFII